MYPHEALPCYGQPALPWRHVLLTAATGGRLEEQVLGVFSAAVDRLLERDPAEVTEEDVDRLLARLPETCPERRFDALAEPLGVEVGESRAGGRSQGELLHDALVELRDHWAPVHARRLLELDGPVHEQLAALLYLWVLLDHPSEGRT